MPISINYSSGSPRNLVVRFVYQPSVSGNITVNSSSVTRTINPLWFNGENVDQREWAGTNLNNYRNDPGTFKFGFVRIWDVPFWGGTAEQVDEVVRRAKNAGLELMVIIMNPKLTDANWAASRVRHFRDIGYPVKYFEFGNENDINDSSTPDGPCDQNISCYNDAFEAAYNAMKAVDPTIKIGGPVVANPLLPFMTDFLSRHGNKVDFVDYHNYAPYGQQQGFIDLARNVRGKMNQYLVDNQYRRKDQVPLLLTEWDHEIQGNPSSIHFISAIYHQIKGGLDGSVRYQHNDHYREEFSSPWGYSLYNSDDSRESKFYYHQIIRDYLGDQVLESSSDEGDILVLATKKSVNNEVNVIVINAKDRAVTKTVTVGGVGANASFRVILWNDQTYPPRVVETKSLAQNTLSYQIPAKSTVVFSASSASAPTSTPAPTNTPTPRLTTTSTPAPTTVIPTSTSAPTPTALPTLSSLTFGGRALDLSGQNFLQTTLTSSGGPIDIPIVANYLAGSSRNLVVRFNYQPQAVNLALNRPVIASSNPYSSDGFDKNFIADGNWETRWSSDKTDQEWIYIDLGQRYDISKVVLKWEDYYYGIDYQIKVSDGGGAWTPIFSRTGWAGGDDSITNLSGSGRYVSFQGSKRRDNDALYSIREFEVYGTVVSVTPTTTPTPTNTPTQVPTSTPIPTATEAPTSTPDPAASPTAAPTSGGGSNTVYAIRFGGQPLDPSGQSPVTMRLPGQEGQQEYFLVPIDISLTSGSPRTTTVKMVYRSRGGQTVSKDYDLNNDKIINSFDVGLFFNEWRKKLNGEETVRGDLNADEFINSVDYSLLKSRIGKRVQ